ncbi:MAG: MoxR family ATPase, partial [bacterium]|nr:MoxR family ATPase [bacterium]
MANCKTFYNKIGEHNMLTMTRRKKNFTDEEAEDFRQKLVALKQEIHKDIIRMDEQIDALIITLLAGVETRFHTLFNAEPGTGKTKLVNTLARAVNLQFSRQQFTPDVEPKDLYIGFGVLEAGKISAQEMPIRPGALFTEILLADEINRTPGKTQSVLLEAAEEKQVTMEGKTYPCSPSSLFYLIGTLNPVESDEAVYPLGAALSDRISFLVTVNFPDEEMISEVVARDQRPKEFKHVLTREDLIKWGKLIYQNYSIPLKPDHAIVSYISRIVLACRNCPARTFGPSVRAGEDMKIASAVTAFLAGKDKIGQEDIKKIAPPSLRGVVGLRLRNDNSLEDMGYEIKSSYLESAEPAL